MGINVRREKAIQLQRELDEAQTKFDEAKDALRQDCPHSYLLEYEDFSHYDYTRHFMCMTCGLWEDYHSKNRVLDAPFGKSKIVKHVDNCDEYCIIRLDIFRDTSD